MIECTMCKYVKGNFSEGLLHKKSISQKPESGFIRDLFKERFIEFTHLEVWCLISINYKYHLSI